MMIIKMVFVFLSGKAFHKLVEAGCRDFFFTFRHKSIRGVSLRCWGIWPNSYFRPNMMAEFKVRVLCRPLTFFLTKLGKTFHYGLWPSCHVDTGKGLYQTVATKLEEHSSLKMSLYMVKSVQNLNNLIPKKMFGLLEKYNV